MARRRTPSPGSVEIVYIIPPLPSHRIHVASHLDTTFYIFRVFSVFSFSVFHLHILLHQPSTLLLNQYEPFHHSNHPGCLAENQVVRQERTSPCSAYRRRRDGLSPHQLQVFSLLARPPRVPLPRTSRRRRPQGQDRFDVRLDLHRHEVVGGFERQLSRKGDRFGVRLDLHPD